LKEIKYFFLVLKILFLYQINTILYQIHLQTNFFITKSPFSHHFSHQNHLKNTIFLSKNTLKTTIFPSKITVLYQNPPFSYQIHIKTHHFYIKNHHFYIKITPKHPKNHYFPIKNPLNPQKKPLFQRLSLIQARQIAQSAQSGCTVITVTPGDYAASLREMHRCVMGRIESVYESGDGF
jgi:hypothetical protein